MKYYPFLSLILILTMSSCQTTGDPTQGGLLGWSRDKYNANMSQKRAIKADLDAENRQLAAEQNRLENKVEQKKETLRSYQQ